MSSTGMKVSFFFIPCVACVRRREREQRTVDSGSICCGRREAGVLPAGRQLPECLRFENLPLSP